MTNFRPGDKVRVTYDVVVNKDGYFCGQYVSRHRPNISGHVVELIQPADDPSKDLVGAVRQNRHETVVVLIDSRDDAPWAAIVGNPGALYEHEDVIGWEKLAPVEGTPAALGLKPGRYPFPVGTRVEARDFVDNTWHTGVLVEPDEYQRDGEVTYKRDGEGDNLHYAKVGEIKALP